jgi:hypothetical protein
MATANSAWLAASAPIATSMALGMIVGLTTSSELVVTHSNPVYRKMPRISAETGDPWTPVPGCAGLPWRTRAAAPTAMVRATTSVVMIFSAAPTSRMPRRFSQVATPSSAAT